MWIYDQYWCAGGLLRSKDVAIVDMLSHASIMDGVECRNKIFFKHNDMQSLEFILNRSRGQYSNMIVVVDGVYSMDGDIANLPEISGLCKKYGALLMVDEAHAFGVLGEGGLGMTDYFDMPPDTIDILVGTFSKAIGSAGGFVTGKKELITYLRYASRPFMFTTAPFIPAMAAALESIRVIKEDRERRTALWRNIRYFKSKLITSGFNIGNSETSIFPIILGNHNRVLDVARIMGTKGVLATGFPYPVVSRKQTRVRMTVTAGMTFEQLDKGHQVLCDSIALSEASDKVLSMETAL
jgi:glycine C-acetyltransferase